MRAAAVAWGAVAILLGTPATGRSQLFRSFNDGGRAILEGNWQSCREDDGTYSERVFDNTLPGIGPFELHLGPQREFALFKGVREEHRNHDSLENLLYPYNVELEQNRAKHVWEVAGLHFEVSLAGGSRNDCESWFILLRRVGEPSS